MTVLLIRVIMTNMNGSTTQRNQALDCLRAVACILVVWLHSPFPSVPGAIVLTFSRIAVPLFFLISGYLFYREEDVTAVAKRRITSVLRLILLFLVLYGVYFVIQSQFDWAWMAEAIPWREGKTWLFFLLCNDIGGLIALLSPAWFLFALLYCYVLFWLFGKLRLWKVVYWLILPLFFCLLLLSEYLPLSGAEVPSPVYRNFFLTGLPFMLTGHFVHHVQGSLCKIPDLVFGTGAVLGLLLPLIVVFFVLDNYYTDGTEHYTGTVVASVCLFVLAVKHPAQKLPLLPFVGRNLSLYVYVVHFLVISLLAKVLLGETVVIRLLRPICAVFVSLGVAWLFWWVQTLWHKGRKGRIQ